MTSINPDAANQNRESARLNRDRALQEIESDGSFEDLAMLLKSIAKDIADAYSCIMEYAYSDSDNDGEVYRKYVVARAMIIGTNYIQSRYSGSENTFHATAATIQLLEVIDNAGFLPQCADSLLESLTSTIGQSGLDKLPDTEIEIDVFGESGLEGIPLSESYYSNELYRMKQLAGIV